MTNVDDERVDILTRSSVTFFLAILYKIISDFMGYDELGAGAKAYFACVAGGHPAEFTPASSLT